MRAKSTAPVSTPHTGAWIAFERNAASFGHMSSFGLREMTLLKAETIRVISSLSKLLGPKKKEAATKVPPLMNHFLETMENRVDRYKTVTLWQVVILVTCVEAYLQDLLCIAASVDPELMVKSQQLTPYTDVIAANSLAELANDLRARWAREWLSDGGPTRWILRLESMGARGYPDDLAPRLELIWGIRHVVVHAAGVVTADFVKWHPGVGKAVGDRLNVGSRDHTAFLKAVADFMQPTEEFFLARYPSLSATTSTRPNK